MCRKTANFPAPFYSNVKKIIKNSEPPPPHPHLVSGTSAIGYPSETLVALRSHLSSTFLEIPHEFFDLV